jgi:hypothetical protein
MVRKKYRTIAKRNTRLVFASFAISFIIIIPLFSSRIGDTWPVSHVSSSSTSTVSLSPITCLNALHPAVTLAGPKIGIVDPTFTATPYSLYPSASFYGFYHKYAGVKGPVTSDLGMLNTSLTYGWGNSGGWGFTWSLYTFLASAAAQKCGLLLGKNLNVITDIDIHNGVLFSSNGSRNFDTLIVGFSEYVTAQEQVAYEAFVASGGT